MSQKNRSLVCAVFLCITCAMFVTGCSNETGNHRAETDPDSNIHASQTEKCHDESYCLSVDDYTLSCDGENHYIVFDEMTSSDYGEPCTLADLTFSSVKEMKETVTQGKLQDWQKEVIATAFPKDTRGILICDFDHLLVPETPVGMSVGDVSWSGRSYSFHVSTSATGFGFVQVLPKESYDRLFRTEYEDFFDRDTITVTKIEQSDDQQKTYTYYSTFAGNLMQERYQLTNGDNVFVVDKTYRLDMTNSALNSSTVPSNVTLYCVDGDVHYIVDLFDFSENPTDTWLMQFGLTDYVENAEATNES